MSFLVTRPARPVPGMALRSRLCSAAIFRTSGVERRRSRSSAVSLPLPAIASPVRGAPASAAARAGAGAGAGEGAAGRGGAAAAGADGGGAGGALGDGARSGAGAFGAPAAGAAPAPTSVSILATTVWTATVCPSVTRISASTPAAGEGISASTLSVEISKIGSSRFTVSPTCLIQRDKVPSAMDSPIWGMITSILAMVGLQLVRREPASGPHDVRGLRQHEILELWRVGERHVMRGHAAHRRVEPLERQLVDPGGDLAGDPAGHGVLVDDEHPVGLLHGGEDRLVIHR